MSVLPLDPIPEYQPLLQDDPAEGTRAREQTAPTGFLSEVWYRWFTALITRLLTCLVKLATLSKSNQSAALGATTIYTPSQPGLYHALWYLRITTADAVSSSATVTIRWKDGGNACSAAFAAITGNTITTTGTGTAFISPDSGQPITIEVAYASNTPAAMRYAVNAALVQVA